MLEELKIDRFKERFFSNIESRLSPIKTGIEGFDTKLGGLAPFVVIAGEPKCCKSTLLTQIGSDHLAQGWPLLHWDGENGQRRTIRRYMCATARGSWDKLSTASPAKLDQMYNWFAEKPFYLMHDFISPEKFHETVTVFVEHHPDKPCLVFIDSIQALRKDYQNRRAGIDKWIDVIEDLKLKHEGRLVIVCTSEKNRSAYGEAYKGGAKESGAIEYKAEQLIDLRACKEGTIAATILENRDGPDGVKEGVVMLEKVLQDVSDPRSFVHRLQEAFKF